MAKLSFFPVRNAETVPICINSIYRNSASCAFLLTVCNVSWVRRRQRSCARSFIRMRQDSVIFLSALQSNYRTGIVGDKKVISSYLRRK